MNSYFLVGMKRKLGSKGQVVVPKEIRQKLGLGEGSTLTFELRPEPSPDEIVERFLSVKGRKRRALVDWKSALDDEYKVPVR